MPTKTRILLLLAPVVVVIALSALANAAVHVPATTSSAVWHQPLKHHAVKHSKKVRVKAPVRKPCSAACVRAKNLRAVVVRLNGDLAKSVYNDSPMRQQLVGIVKASRSAGISPFFLLAIAGQESGFGVNACRGNAGNAWGWGRCHIQLADFTVGAHVVAGSLRSNYLDNGLTTIDSVARSYCPPTKDPDCAAWPDKIRHFMTEVFRVNEGLRWSDAVRSVRT